MKKFLFLAACFMLAVTSCEKKEPPPPVPYATFTVKGVAKKFENYHRFSKDLCSSSTFCCQFLQDTSVTSPTLKIGIPGDPLVGKVYSTGEYRFSCWYFDENGIRYDLATAPFQVVFTQWDGQGGWGKGNFSGWMKNETGDSIEFKDGYFQNKIWTMGE